MVKLQEAENQIVVAYEVYDRRPSDSDLLLAAIETHQATLGCTPHLVAADAGFSTRPRTRRPRKPRVSSASASPTAPPRAPSANANKRSVGFAPARNGEPAARVA